MQRDALFNALIEILRTISDKGKVTMVLPSEDEVLVDHSASYFHDTITEKVCIEKFLHSFLSNSNFSYPAALRFYTIAERGAGALYEAKFKIRRNPS